MRKSEWLALVAVLLVSGMAEAARRPFAFTFDTDSLNSGDLELEEWVTEKKSQPAPKPDTGWLWFGPVYGVSQQVEVALPFEAAVTSDQTMISDFAVDTRIRLFDPLDNDRFVRPLLRVFYQFNFKNPLNGTLTNLPWIGADLVTSFGDPAGSHASLDVGAFSDVALALNQVRYQTVGAGYTRVVTQELRVGAEYYHEISLGSVDKGNSRFYLGPDVSFSRGQLWFTLGVPIRFAGTGSALLPRAVIGIRI